MTEEIVQIGLVGPNPPEIIGLKQVRANKHGGYDSVGDAVLVNLSFQVNGTVFTIQSEQQIPMELFQHLKQAQFDHFLMSHRVDHYSTFNCSSDDFLLLSFYNNN